MAKKSTLRWRHTAAQLHALEKVQREIHATDPHLRRKYLRDFSAAFSTYQDVLSPDDLTNTYEAADVLLVGDYHSLPASQQFASELIRHLAGTERKVILGVEFIFARDQQVLDSWHSGRISGPELRARIRFDSDWGYDWRPFYRLLQTGRDFAARIVALDRTPRNDISKIAARDRHAAAKLADARHENPDDVVVALFGESHLAPNHLPDVLRRRRPHDRIVTVLQNIDPLYWSASRESCDRLEGVSVAEDVVCVFNSTPLQKYESYRFCIERWQQGRVRSRAPRDRAPRSRS